MNLFRGSAGDGIVSAGSFAFAREGVADGPVTVGVRPEVFRPAGDEAVAGPRIELLVEVVEPLGDEVLVHGSVDARAAQSGAEEEDAMLLADGSTRAPVTVRLEPGTRSQPGDRMPLVADPAAIHLFGAETGERLA